MVLNYDSLNYYILYMIFDDYPYSIVINPKPITGHRDIATSPPMIQETLMAFEGGPLRVSKFVYWVNYGLY